MAEIVWTDSAQQDCRSGRLNDGALALGVAGVDALRQVPYTQVMRAQEIERHARKRPLVPLRIFVCDGSKFDVRHPEFIWVTHREIMIGIPRAGDRLIPEEAVYIDPVHITRIQPINGKKRRAKTG